MKADGSGIVLDQGTIDTTKSKKPSEQINSTASTLKVSKSFVHEFREERRLPDASPASTGRPSAIFKRRMNETMTVYVCVCV